MVAVGGDDMVVLTHQRNGPNCHRLLPNVEVEESAHHALVVILERCLLEAPDADHFPKKTNLLLRFERGIDFRAGVICWIHGYFVIGDTWHRA